MANFYSGEFLSGGFFGDNDTVAGGKGDNPSSRGRKKGYTFKPTGLPPIGKTTLRVRSRIEETHEIAKEIEKETRIPEKIIEVGLPPAAYTPLVTPISLMQTEQIVDEIRYLMRQKMQRDEAIALILIAANL